MAMQEIKRIGTGEHILRFTPELLKNEHTLEMEGKLRTALDNDNVFFLLQPQYDMSHKLRGFEALARMRDDDGTIIPPIEFIPVAEKVGLIDRIDSVVFKKASEFVGELARQHNLDVTLSINISVRHLMKKDFLEEIRNQLAQSNLPADRLELEITESVMIESLEKAMDCIEALRDMGVQIAIDDFGTGYSSLSYLNDIPANLLKIDKTFIDGMNSSEKSKQYVAAIISLGHIMGYKVISEGVEENDQLEVLKQIGCDFVQGYIWGRPLLPKDVEKLVSES
jgi:EAL domain-containing protein (putative c-di-GMP-specific phosphodiesterase class I)